MKGTDLSVPTRAVRAGTAPAGKPRIPTRADARRRAWLVAGCVALGVLGGRRAAGLDVQVVFTAGRFASPLSPILFGLAGLCAAIMLVTPSQLARALVLVAAVLVGMGVASARLAESPPDHLSRLLAGAGPADPPALVRVRGLVLTEPALSAPDPESLDAALARFAPPTLAFDLALESLVTEGTPRHVSGSLRVYTDAETSTKLRAGDRIEALGLLRAVRAPANPGEPNGRLWARQSGEAGALRTGADTITVLGTGAGLRSVYRRTLANTRARALTLIDGDAPGGDIVRAMLLGERSPGSRESALFVRTGTSHLLAISGFHLSVLAALTVGVVRLTGDYPRAEAVVGVAFLIAYCLLLPANTPIVRAALLTGSLLVAHFFARRWDRLTILGWITALLIVARPMDLTTLGFQLTVGVTALLIWMTSADHPWVTGRTARLRLDAALGRPAGPGKLVLGWARAGVVTSVLVWLVTAPLILYHTGSVNPLTPIAVTVSTPIASGLQAVGMAGLLASIVSAPIGSAFLEAALWMGRALAWVTALFDAADARRVVEPVSWAWALAATGASLTLIVRAHLRDWRPWLLVAAVLVWGSIEMSGAGRTPRGVAARVDMLAVGDGSCLLVRAGNDAVLWDAGSLRPGMGVRTIPRALRALGGPRVRRALVTHDNIDHYGALPDLADTIGLEEVFISAPALATMRAAPHNSPARLFLNAIESEGIAVLPIARGDTLAIGRDGATLRALWPPETPPVNIRAANDRSLVARLEVPTDAGERRALLVGDIQRSAMLMLLADHSVAEAAPGGALLDADILELPHHGSHHPVAESFVRAVSPSAVLQSTGPSRARDRRWNTVKRETGGAWRITALDGAVWAEIRDEGTVTSGGFREQADSRR